MPVRFVTYWGKMISTVEPNIHIETLLEAAVHHHQSGRLLEAEQLYDRILNYVPEHSDALHLRGLVALQNGQLNSASALIRQAIKRNAGRSIFYNSLGNVYEAEGQHQKAISAYRRALVLQPDYAEAHYNLGNVLQAGGQLKEAAACYRRALKYNPKMAVAYNNLGVALNELENEPEAIECYRQAIEHMPEFIDGYNNLAAILEGRNRLEEARQAVASALHLDPGSYFANLNFAQLEYRSGNYTASLDLLNNLPGEAPAELAPKAHTLRGMVCDKLGRHQEAFDAFEKGNACEMATDRYRRLEPDRISDLAWLNRLQREADRQECVANHREENSDPGPAPVFLVGFPRSGTTLLQQMLKVHSKITALEEKPILEHAAKCLLGGDPHPDEYFNFDERLATELRHLYWSLAYDLLSSEQPPEMVLDKLPLNIIYLGFIRRMFPDAKIIVALRHPADAVLSNFMQRYKLNKRMANFLNLDHAAQFYAVVMSLYLSYRSKLGENILQVRYEDIVQNTEFEARRLLAFLELDWEENVLRFNELARGKNINTPSYSQVIKPIYRDAVSRWKKYEKQMAQAIVILDPFIKAFGY